MKLHIFAAILAATASTAVAMEPETRPTVLVMATIADPLLADFAAVCNSAAVLSEKADAACDANSPPKTNKVGDTFRNVGIGAEFNALIRNLPLIAG